jgi:hypothetical protein
LEDTPSPFFWGCSEQEDEEEGLLLIRVFWRLSLRMIRVLLHGRGNLKMRECKNSDNWSVIRGTERGASMPYLREDDKVF